MSFWVDASLFALLVWASEHALFLVCALACVVGPRLTSSVGDELLLAAAPARA